MKVSVNRQTPLRLARRARPWGQLLRLEDRITPAVTWAFDKVTGIVTATGDAANDVIVFTRNQDQFVEVNGTPVALGSPGQQIPLYAVRGYDIDGGEGDDRIDAQLLSKQQKHAEFAQVDVDKEVWRQDFGQVKADRHSDVRIAGGTGNDTISGSNYADNIVGGVGADSISGGIGDDIIEGTWADLASDLMIDGGTGVNGVALTLPGTSSSLGTEVNAVTAAVKISHLGQGVTFLNADDFEVTVANDALTSLTVDGSSIGATSGMAWSATKQSGGIRISIKDLDDDSSLKVRFLPSGPSSGDIPTESISFNFAKIKMEYRLTGSDGDDTFTIEPGTTPTEILGGLGNDKLTVGHGGLGVTQTATSFTVAGKAPVTFSGIEAASSALVLTEENAARDFMAANKISVTSKAGLTPDSTVYSISNSGDRPIESISFNFSKIEWSYRSDKRQTGPGVTVSETFYPEGVSNDDLARGVSPGKKDLEFSIASLAPGSSATFAVSRMGQTNVLARYPFHFRAVAPPSPVDPTPVQIETSLVEVLVGVSIAGGLADITALATPPQDTPTLLGATANGTALTLSSITGVDPTVPNYLPGAHLHHNGRLIDATSDGLTSGNGSVTSASVDYTGSTIVFTSSSTNLTADPPDLFDDIFMDGPNGLVKITRAATAQFVDGHSRNAKVSGDGSYIVFESKASNLVPGVIDTNNDWDLFVFDVATKSTQYVAGAAMGGLRTGWDLAKGKKCVAYVVEPPVGPTTVNVWDGTQTKQIELLSWSFGTSNAGMRLSDDGSTLAFWTDASVSGLVGVPDTNGVFDLLSIDTATLNVTPLSLNAAGTATANGATPAHKANDVDLSCDGGRVYFTTAATDSVTGGGPGGGPHVKVFDGITMKALAPLAISEPPDGIALRAAPCGKKIKWDTLKDLRATGAPDFIATETYVWDSVTGLIDLVSVDNSGNPSGGSKSHAFANDGGAVLFTTSAKLTADDTDTTDDVYVSRVHVTLTAPVSGGVTVATGDLNGDGQAEVFAKNALGTVTAQRPASATNFAILIGSATADSVTLDIDSGLTGLTAIDFDGGAGADQITFQSASAEIGAIKAGLSVGPTAVAVHGGWNLKKGTKFHADVPTFSRNVETVVDGTNFDSATVDIFTDTAVTVNIGDDGVVGNGLSQVSAAGVSVITGAGPGGGPNVRAFNGRYITTAAPSHTITIGAFDSMTPVDAFAWVIGGEGNDTITADFASHFTDIDGNRGDDLIRGGKFPIRTKCRAGFDTIIGSSAGDTFIISRDAGDLVTGGGGSDTISFESFDRPVTFNVASTAVQTITGSGQKLTLTDAIENLVGSPYSDSFSAKFVSGQEGTATDGGSTDGSSDSLTLDAGGKLLLLTPQLEPFDPRCVVDLAAGKYCWSTTIFTDIVNEAPPAPPSPQVNGGEVQRSRVGEIVIPFNYAPDFKAGPENAFQLKTAGGAAVPFTVEVQTAGGLTTVILTPGGPFVEHGSLVDGKYSLTVVSSMFFGGLPGGDDVVRNFHRLFGDVNGDEFTDNVDFIQYRLANGSDSTSANYNPAFDFNGDGFIDNVDFIAFRQRIGMSP